MTLRSSSLLEAAAMVGIGLMMLYPIDDPDVWWLLRAGAYMVETRSFPTTDPFSGPAFGAPWVNHAWGFELVLFGVYRLAGTTGLVVLQALAALATFAVLYALLRREGVGRAPALLAITAGALATRGFWAPRPQLVTYLAFAAYWAILRDYRDGRADRVLWLPILTAAWANLHGGYMVGPALIALALTGEMIDRLLGTAPPAPGAGRPGRLAQALGACLLASFATPFHYHAVLFPFQVLGDRVAQAFIIEWASPPFQHGAIRLAEGLMLLTLALAAWARRRWRAADVLVLAAFSHFGFQAVRNLPLLVIVLLPILMAAVTDTLSARLPALVARSGVSPRRFGVTAAAAGLALALWWTFPTHGVRDVLPRVGVAETFPAGAVEYLRRTRPPGPLFNDYGWGGYLIWRLYPDYRVSIDGRMAVHGPRRFADHIEVAKVRPRWREAMARLDARLAVLHTNSPLAIVLKASPEWQLLYEDRVAVVLARREARS